MSVSPVLRAEAVGTWLGGSQILHGIDLAVHPGEVVALLGGNGSGKTTLLRTLLGLIPHQTGSVALFGVPLTHFHDWPRIGYVPQHARLQVPGATAREIVLLGRLSRRSLFRPASGEDRRAVDEALEKVGMQAMGSRPMVQLSGGQQQRVLIARALVGRTDLLVLDEPLAALDLRTQTSLARLMAGLHEQGMTILTVLHELGAMEPLLTRGVVLRNGHIIHDGPLSAGPGLDDCLPSGEHPQLRVVGTGRDGLLSS